MRQHDQSHAGTFSISISDTPLATVSRTASSLRSVACRDTTGNTAVAMETPNKPIGSDINRNAYCSHETAPVSCLLRAAC